jgi:hypothetical protein
MVSLQVWRLLGSLALAAAITGCYMQVKIDGGVDSPFEDLHAGVVAYTGRGEGFSERKAKEVYVNVFRRGTNPVEYLFSTKLIVTAADLDWDIKWKSRDEVQIDFFEYPPGVSRWSDAAVNRKVPTIPVKTVTLVRTGERQFREKS